MSKTVRGHLRRAHVHLTTMLAGALLAAAVAVALVQALLPLAAHYPRQMANFLSWRLGTPVSFEQVRGAWQPSGPLFNLLDLRIGKQGDELLHLDHARLKFDFGAWLKPRRRWIELRIDGTSLHVVHTSSGKWQLRGLGDRARDSGDSLSSLPVDLLVSHATLLLDDRPTGQHYRLQVERLKAANVGDGVRVAASLRLSDAAAPVRAPMHVSVQLDPEHGETRLYLAARNLDLARISPLLRASPVAPMAGSGSVRAWLEWRRGEFIKALAQVNIGNLRMRAGHGREADFPILKGLLGIERSDCGWRVRYAGNAGAGGVPGVLWSSVCGGAQAGFVVNARDLPFALVQPFAQLSPRVPTAAARWLAEAAPRGELDRVSARGDGNTFQVDAAFHGLGLQASAAIPGLRALRGELHGDSHAWTLDLPDQSITISDPQVLREDIALTHLQGSIIAWPQTAGWRFATPGLSFDAADFGGAARGDVLIPGDGSGVRLDLAAALTHGDVAAARKFWPVDLMPPEAVDWLDRALVGGRVTGARVLVRGNVADWPFRHHEGHFEAIAHVGDATLDYGDQWPQAQDIDATVSFLDAGMRIEATHVQALDNPIDHASAQIPDLATPQISLAVQANGDAGKLLDFVRHSPVGAHEGSFAGLDLSGHARVALDLVLPIEDMDAFTLQGRSEVSAVRLRVPERNLDIRDIAGVVQFDRDGLAAQDLAARFHDAPARLDVLSGAHTRENNHALEASLQGHFNLPALLSTYPQLSGISKRVHGSTRMRLGLSMATAAAPSQQGAQRLQIDSDLQGVTLDLPAPLDKPGGIALPAHMDLNLPLAGTTLDLVLGHRARLRARLPGSTSTAAVSVALGDTALPALADNGLVVRGDTARLDISGWAQFALGQEAANQDSSSASDPAERADVADARSFPERLQLRSVDVSSAQAQLFGHSFGELAIKAHPHSRGIRIELAGPRLDGILDLPESMPQRGVTAHLTRLHWPEEATDSHESAATDAKPGLADINPGRIPALHLLVDDLQFGHANLGQARLESSPSANGMRIDQLETVSPDLEVHARGNWTGATRQGTSDFSIDLSSPDLGRMLDALGYPGLLAGGQTLAHIQARWPGPPSAFALARLDGSMTVDVGKGRILEVKPGVGRLFGLVSIRELPRRLALDFGDFFRSGFSFNTLKGSFELHDGDARTRDLKIKGPSADISINGRTGLRAHDYDQQVRVVPHVGGTLPLVGAIAGGPVGAAAGLAVQTLLGKGLNRAASARYHISGSWENPTIKLVSRGSVTRPPAPRSEHSAPASAATSIPPATTSEAPAD